MSSLNTITTSSLFGLVTSSLPTYWFKGSRLLFHVVDLLLAFSSFSYLPLILYLKWYLCKRNRSHLNLKKKIKIYTKKYILVIFVAPICVSIKNPIHFTCSAPRRSPHSPFQLVFQIYATAYNKNQPNLVSLVPVNNFWYSLHNLFKSSLSLFSISQPSLIIIVFFPSQQLYKQSFKKFQDKS